MFSDTRKQNVLLPDDESNKIMFSDTGKQKGCAS